MQPRQEGEALGRLVLRQLTLQFLDTQISMPNTRPDLISIVIPEYKNAESAIRTVDSLFELHRPHNTIIEVIVVDDGSGDKSADRIEQACPKANIVRLQINNGRAAARNLGARFASGKYLLFIDCDCIPADRNFLLNHAKGIQKGAVASCGPTYGGQSGFWRRYQLLASTRRGSQIKRGISYAGTSSNLLVDREIFCELGGFDRHYQAYGFEDRDLLIRLADRGHITWSECAAVCHNDKLDTVSVCEKMMLAGEFTGPIFALDHPEAYRELRYERIDVRYHLDVKLVVAITGSQILLIAKWLDRLLTRGWVPFRVGFICVRLLTAISYASGTANTD